MTTQFENATLGGGCFWCLEAIFSRIKGVTHLKPGYAGGKLLNPNYELISQGNTGHAEVIRFTFDNQECSYEEILNLFFAAHNPTTLNSQGNDIGSQYRSIILAENEGQYQTALSAIKSLSEKRVFDAPIVTEVKLLENNFWPAEDYHFNYYENHPQQSYCSYVISPKLAALSKKFVEKWID